jgi:hypothetical protein
MRSSLFLVAMLAAAGLLQAQLNQLPMPDLGNLTASAILGWYAWHTASKTIPDIVAQFRAELSAARAEFRSETALFREELATERKQRHADNQTLAAALHELAQQW